MGESGASVRINEFLGMKMGAALGKMGQLGVPPKMGVKSRRNMEIEILQRRGLK